jgi:hypothetical protein
MCKISIDVCSSGCGKSRTNEHPCDDLAGTGMGMRSRKWMVPHAQKCSYFVDITVRSCPSCLEKRTGLRVQEVVSVVETATSSFIGNFSLTNDKGERLAEWRKTICSGQGTDTSMTETDLDEETDCETTDAQEPAHG